MIIVPRDIYLVLLGGAIGFISGIGGAIGEHLLAIRRELLKEEREKVRNDANELRKRLSGDDDSDLRKRLLHAP